MTFECIAAIALLSLCVSVPLMTEVGCKKVGSMKNADACLEDTCMVNLYDDLKSMPTPDLGSSCSDAVHLGKNCLSSSKSKYSTPTRKQSCYGAAVYGLACASKLVPSNKKEIEKEVNHL